MISDVQAARPEDSRKRSLLREADAQGPNDPDGQDEQDGVGHAVEPDKPPVPWIHGQAFPFAPHGGVVPCVSDRPAAEEEPEGAEQVSGNHENREDIHGNVEAAGRREPKVEAENRSLDEQDCKITGDRGGNNAELEAASIFLPAAIGGCG